jgi:cell pole-organizing protein PopZ
MEEILASIRRIISEDSEPGKTPAQSQPAPAQSRQAEPDVLELTQVAVEEPPPERRAPPERPRAVKPEPAPRPAPVLQQVRPESDLAMVDNDDRDGLVSNHTQSAISQAFNMLQRDRSDRDIPVSAGEARTLEDIVAAMLRPMLKDWLEEHLPETVERIVREEVERAARGAGGGRKR